MKNLNINRLEIIDHSKNGKGREMVKWDNDIEFFLDRQDNEKTIKIFIKDKEE